MSEPYVEKDLGVAPENEEDEYRVEANAALQAGLLPMELMPIEKEHLGESFDILEYFEIRNHMLYLWNSNSQEYLTVQKCMSRLSSKYASLVNRIHGFLEQFGFINTGALKLEASKSPHFNKSEKKKVVVIGAGMSGLATARQLKSFGHEVIVVEGRDRIGGRVCTDYGFGGAVDLGASIITGLVSNPISTVVKQLDTKYHVIRNACPIFTEDGKPLNEELDQRLEFEYNTILEGTDALRGSIAKEAAESAEGGGDDEGEGDDGVSDGAERKEESAAANGDNSSEMEVEETSESTVPTGETTGGGSAEATASSAAGDAMEIDADSEAAAAGEEATKPVEVDSTPSADPQFGTDAWTETQQAVKKDRLAKLSKASDEEIESLNLLDSMHRVAKEMGIEHKPDEAGKWNLCVCMCACVRFGTCICGRLSVSGD